MKRIQAAFTKLLALGLLVAPFMSTVGRDAVRVSASEAREIKPAFLLPTYFAPAAPSVRATADVLLIDDDLSNGSRSAECHDYRSIYTQALTAAGLSYSIFETTSTTPDPGTSPRPHFVNFEGASIYRLVIYFSGDSHCGQELGWNVPQMRAYLNGGGRMIVFSQDALYFDKANEDAALSVPTTFSPTLYFGASYITDTIAVAAVQGSGSFSYTTGITHTIGVTATSIDRAGLAVVSGADPAVILSKSSDPTQIVGTRMSSDPSIESDLGLFVRQDMAYRTQLVTYGLEDITNVNDRAKLLDMLAGYELDRLTVSFNSPVFDANNNHDGTTTISATATSNITHTATGFSNVIVKYRWDFGDNSPIVTTTVPSAKHTYTGQGLFRVIVEATDGFGVRVTSESTVDNIVLPVPVPAAEVLSIAPNTGPTNMANDVTIFWSNLQPGLAISISNNISHSLLQNITIINTTTVQAVVPKGMAAGTYTLTVRNPGSGLTSVMQYAYTVIDPNSLIDDYYAGTDDLWTEPYSFRRGAIPELGVVVYRNGGLLTETVDVSFYAGNPVQGWTFLGTGTTQEIGPGLGSYGMASILWDTANYSSTVDIYAVIDPFNQYTETNKLNNIAKHTFTIIPVLNDDIPPTIGDVTLNGGAQITRDPVINVTLVATDTGGSQLQSMYLIERVYSVATHTWVKVKDSGWLPYQSTFTMTMINRGGAHYYQVWVADGRGNIVAEPVMRRINYINTGQSVREGDTNLYQLNLAQGEKFTATLTTVSGDADLYVWQPDTSSAGESVNSGTGTDVVTFTVPVSGVYSVEVYGYLDSVYNFDMLGVSLSLNRPAAALLSPAATKPPHTPVSAPESTPIIDLPIPPAAPIVFKVKLWFMVMNDLFVVD